MYMNSNLIDPRIAETFGGGCSFDARRATPLPRKILINKSVTTPSLSSYTGRGFIHPYRHYWYTDNISVVTYTSAVITYTSAVITCAPAVIIYVPAVITDLPTVYTNSSSVKNNTSFLYVSLKN
jgi:hypothetical protein